MSDPVKVLVLYDHPLLGEGLTALMQSVPDLAVERIAMADPDAMRRALDYDPDVVVLEEGGPVGLVDVLRTSRARAIVDVSISTSEAWAIRREAIAPDPESLIDRIVRACLADREPVATGPGLPGARAAVPAGPVTG